MSIIRPFQAVRPDPKLASFVASLPYDVMNTSEARQMTEGNTCSFIHVSRAEVDFPVGTDEHSAPVYEKARNNFYRMIDEGVLFQDACPSLYIYEQMMGGRRQTGLVACSGVEDYFNNVIKKHELTRPEKEEDRIKHMEALQAHVGPVFLTYPQNISVDQIIDEITGKQEPVYDFQAIDGVKHTVWVISEEDKIDRLVSIFKTEIPCTYIADGHHRTASAARVGLKMRGQNPHHNGLEEYNFFLSVLFPDNQLQIMDYNRVVKDLNGLTEEQFLKKVSEKFFISPLMSGNSPVLAENAKPDRPHHFGMYVNGTWHRLEAKEEIIKNDPIGILDITILQDHILSPLLGIADPRTDRRIDFVGGIRGLKELQHRVDGGDSDNGTTGMKIAFALFPVSLKQLMDIADSGKIMPPKSTWFEPKLRDGLFSHLF